MMTFLSLSLYDFLGLYQSATVYEVVEDVTSNTTQTLKSKPVDASDGSRGESSGL